MVAIARAISSASYGSTSKAASPAISGREDSRDVTTGVPNTRDSRTGSPKPSYSDGKTTARAPRIRVTRKEGLTYWNRRTRLLTRGQWLSPDRGPLTRSHPSYVDAA